MSCIVGTTCITQSDARSSWSVLRAICSSRWKTKGSAPPPCRSCSERVLARESDALAAALAFACQTLMPALERVSDEIAHVLAALEGRYVPAGPAGAPTRGMAHVLPTGRNFYAVDPRALPSQAAWRVGRQLAREVLERHLAEEGRYPEMIGLGAWGTSQMRTQGDDVAEVLALLGVEPVWDGRSRRVHDLAVIPLERLGRPRIDVTLRISGFFRDAFPHLIDLVDRAVELAVAQDEPIEQNFPRKHYLAELAQARDGLVIPTIATTRKSKRRRAIASSARNQGTYGAGIQALMETRHWESDRDFAKVFVEWGGYAYGREAEGVDARAVFTERLRSGRGGGPQSGQSRARHLRLRRLLSVSRRDDRERARAHRTSTEDLFRRQLASRCRARPRSARGSAARLSQPRRQSQVARRDPPSWLQGRPGADHDGRLHLRIRRDRARRAGLRVSGAGRQLMSAPPEIRDFLAQSNPWALHAIAERLLEAAERGMWSEPDAATLDMLRQTLLDAETLVGARGERARRGDHRWPGGFRRLAKEDAGR